MVKGRVLDSDGQTPVAGANVELYPESWNVYDSLGEALLATLAGSCSYIAAPAAMRIAVPEANPALSLTASLGVTFPFNIFVGIPIYLAIAERLHGA